MIVRHKIAGTYVYPLNPENISLEINHDQESILNQPRPHVGISNLELRREDVAFFMKQLMQFPGITEGIPYDIEITERGVTEIINMYVDCMDGGFSRSKDGVNFGIKMLQSLDWFDGVVDAFTFESMYNETGVTPFTIDGKTYSNYQQYFDERTIYIPYVISTIPNWHDAFLALFGLTYIGTELYKAGFSIQKAIAKFVSDPFQWGEIAGMVLQMAFALILIATLISLINQLIACLIQPLKYHGAMLMSDMLKVVAVKVGLQEKSSIWDAYPYNQIAYLPEKNNINPPSDTLIKTALNVLGFNATGFTQNGYNIKGVNSQAAIKSSSHTSQTDGLMKGYFNGTGGDFLRLLKSFCNGKVIIPDQTNDLVVERRDWFPTGTPYQLPDIRQDWNGYNVDELSATIEIKFQSDLNERNCIDFIDKNGNAFYPGTILQATHQQIQTVDASMVCLKGLRQININVARGAAKDKLTFVEQAITDLKVIWEGIGFLVFIAIDVIIIILDAVIVAINIIISVLLAIIDIMNTIIDAVNWIPNINISEINTDNGLSTISLLPLINPFSSFDFEGFDNRLNALLLENDIISTPKMVLVDTQRAEFISDRIAYLHADNATTINAKYLWDKFYAIDAFVGTPNNRFTKITPSLNNPSETNPTTLSLKDFKGLVSNPQFNDNFAEKVIADSIMWYPEQNGKADFVFRKQGWLADPQNPKGSERAKELAINLQINISLPNGN